MGCSLSPGPLSGGESKGKNQPEDSTFLLCTAMRVTLLGGRPCTQITGHRTRETSVFFLGLSQHPVHEASGNTRSIERAPVLSHTLEVAGSLGDPCSVGGCRLAAPLQTPHKGLTQPVNEEGQFNLHRLPTMFCCIRRHSVSKTNL